jgi:pyridoxamine 5'-phosphate oxidase
MVADLRKEYTQAGLSEADVQDTPMAQFGVWFQQALDANIHEPNAMTVATVDASGRPSARIVLLKGFSEAGLVFFTNYESRKGQALAAHPYAALIFYWPELERQVRVEGPVSKVPAADADAYFDSRPKGSRLGAWASPQSRVIASRTVLEDNLAMATKQFAERVPRPPFWGGYLVTPELVEFWQGRPSRLHDRLRYRRDEATEAWVCERLAP